MYRECPFCAEEILAKAKLCKHCKSEVEPVSPSNTRWTEPLTKGQSSNNKRNYSNLKYCHTCNISVEPKRQIGVGSLLLFLVTCGLSIFAIPFYSKRCPTCKNKM